MCVTCGCSDGVGVRITDLATGESTTLDTGEDSHLHQHLDAEGRPFLHAHPVTIHASRVLGPGLPPVERRHG